MRIPANIPNVEARYLKSLVTAITELISDKLIGIYLFGSASYGGYKPGTSDLDIQMVTRDSLLIEERKLLVRSISHSTIPCPAKKLEFVSYPYSAVQLVSRSPEFDVNFNTGENETEHICFDYKKEPSHWFVLDIAIGRELGQSIIGPHPKDIFGKVKRPLILESMYKCINWYKKNCPESKELATNACRCLVFLETDYMCSKVDSLVWALENKKKYRFLHKLNRDNLNTGVYSSDIFSFVSDIEKRISDELNYLPE